MLVRMLQGDDLIVSAARACLKQWTKPLITIYHGAEKKHHALEKLRRVQNWWKILLG